MDSHTSLPSPIGCSHITWCTGHMALDSAWLDNRPCPSTWPASRPWPDVCPASHPVWVVYHNFVWLPHILWQCYCCEKSNIAIWYIHIVAKIVVAAVVSLLLGDSDSLLQPLHHSVQLCKNPYYGHVRIRLNNYIRFYHMIISNSCLLSDQSKQLCKKDVSNISLISLTLQQDYVRNSYIIILYCCMTHPPQSWSIM